ncbi:hypothetical protein BDR06DRAFT_973924 [Suillus hirtellus]|nr:hypothetical protein BDR06DRAFT_973924 [Suillus hirtellus]
MPPPYRYTLPSSSTQHLSPSPKDEVSCRFEWVVLVVSCDILLEVDGFKHGRELWASFFKLQRRPRHEAKNMLSAGNNRLHWLHASDICLHNFRPCRDIKRTSIKYLRVYGIWNQGPLDWMEDANKITITSISEDEPLVGRRELWSYCLYYNSDNAQYVSHNLGVYPLGYTQTQFQELATAAGYDPIAGAGLPCLATTTSGQCVFPWGNGTKSVSSVVLIVNVISFAIMTVTFATISSITNYGMFGRYLLSQWYAELHNMTSWRLSVHSNVRYIITLLLNLALLLPMTNNAKLDNYVFVLLTTHWVELGIWCCEYIGLNTAGTLVTICQLSKFSFLFLQNTPLGLVTGDYLDYECR